VWLAGLVALCVLAAAGAGSVLYWQSRKLVQTQANAITGGSSERGKQAIVQRGCGACHVISGVPGAEGQVGPDLTSIAERSEIAGRFANDPEQMARWLMHPQALQPGSGMPEMNISQPEARDIAAYLYSTK
jgi:cytochrome c2